MRHFRFTILFLGVLLALGFSVRHVDLLLERSVLVLFSLVPVVYFFTAIKNKPLSVLAGAIGLLVLLIEFCDLSFIFYSYKGGQGLAFIGMLIVFFFLLFWSVLSVFLYSINFRVASGLVNFSGIIFSIFIILIGTVEPAIRMREETKVRSSANMEYIRHIVENSDKPNLIIAAVQNPNSNERIFRSALNEVLKRQKTKKQNVYEKRFVKAVAENIQKHANASEETKIEANLIRKEFGFEEKCIYVAKADLSKVIKENLRTNLHCPK